MNNQPIIFNIKYTPYSLPKNASVKQLAIHKEERTFYDMTGGKNIFSYITRSEKIIGTFSSLDYFQKSTGVFNGNGVISATEVEAMKQRGKENEGNIWHGFISLNQENSYKIDTPEKCIAFVKSTFSSFFKEAHFDEKNLDLMCALHVDRPHHLHIHFQFWEKEPKYKGADGSFHYRRKGKLDKAAIDTMFVKSGIFISEEKDNLYKSRDSALLKLKQMTACNVAMTSTEEIRTKILALTKALPKTGRLSYGSKDMEPYRKRVDEIVKLMLAHDKKARQADKRFYQALEDRKAVIENICGKPCVYSDKNVSLEKLETQPSNYHYRIDEKNIKIISQIEADYKRRQGNLVLSLCKFIKPEYYERRPGKKYKASDTKLKKRLIISEKRVDKHFKKFVSTFGKESELLERDYTHRLQEVEEELKKEKEEQEERYKFE